MINIERNKVSKMSVDVVKMLEERRMTRVCAPMVRYSKWAKLRYQNLSSNQNFSWILLLISLQISIQVVSETLRLWHLFYSDDSCRFLCPVCSCKRKWVCYERYRQTADCTVCCQQPWRFCWCFWAGFPVCLSIVQFTWFQNVKIFKFFQFFEFLKFFY